MNRAGFGAESEASQATGRVHDENLLNQVMKDKRPKTIAVTALMQRMGLHFRLHSGE